MIPKINSCTPVQQGNYRNIRSRYLTPTFGNVSEADGFIKEVAKESIPTTLKDAVSTLCDSLSAKKFKKISIALLEDEDPLIELKKMFLNAEKINVDGVEKILVEVKYDNGDTEGYSILANNSKDNVLKTIKKTDFLDKVKKKLKYMSDKLDEEPEII